MASNAKPSAPANPDLPPPYSPNMAPPGLSGDTGYIQPPQPYPPQFYPGHQGYPQGPPKNQTNEPGQFPNQPPYPQQHYPGQQGYPQVPPQGLPINQTRNVPNQPPYPQQYYPGQQGQHSTIIVGAPVLTTYSSGFRDIPMSTVCPGCGSSVVTQTNFRPGALTWIMCLVMVMVGLFCGCCLIPFCVNSFMDVVHTCPNCHCVIAKRNRL